MSLDYFNRTRDFRMQPAIPLSDIRGRNTERTRVKRSNSYTTGTIIYISYFRPVLGEWREN